MFILKGSTLGLYVGAVEGLCVHTYAALAALHFVLFIYHLRI